MREGLEGLWRMALDGDATPTPRLALGVRHDDGGVTLAMPKRGLTVSLDRRGLLSHAAEGSATPSSAA